MCAWNISAVHSRCSRGAGDAAGISAGGWLTFGVSMPQNSGEAVYCSFHSSHYCCRIFFICCRTRNHYKFRSISLFQVGISSNLIEHNGKLLAGKSNNMLDAFRRICFCFLMTLPITPWRCLGRPTESVLDFWGWSGWLLEKQHVLVLFHEISSALSFSWCMPYT